MHCALLLLLLPGCGGDDFYLAYDQRIRGQVIVPPGSTSGSTDIRVETFDSAAPYVRVSGPADEDGYFDLPVPEGEYRVSSHFRSSTVYYGNGRSRALRAQATPVSAGPAIEAPFLLLDTGALSIELEVPGGERDWALAAYLVNPILGERVAGSSVMDSGPNTARIAFSPTAVDDYEVELVVAWRRSEPPISSDRARLPVEIQGETTRTVSIVGGETLAGRASLAPPPDIRGVFVGPSASRSGATLHVILWDLDYIDTHAQFHSVDLSTTTEFAIPVHFARPMQLQWTVSLPGEDNDETVRWLGAWTRGPSTVVHPSLDLEPIRLEAVGILVDFVRPDRPGFYGGWLEVQDASGVVRGTYYTDDRNDYQGPIFFSNLPPGPYLLHFRPNANVPTLDQWYAEGLALGADAAEPIDPGAAGSLAEITWNPGVGGSISGRATLEDGSAAANHTVVLSLGTSTTYESRTRTDEDGRFLIAGLTKGRYRVGVVRRNTLQVTWYPGTTEITGGALIDIVDYESHVGYDFGLAPLPGGLWVMERRTGLPIGPGVREVPVQ